MAIIECLMQNQMTFLGMTRYASGGPPWTTIVGIDSRCEFVSAQQPVRFRHGPLPMDSLWFDGVEPGALAGQLAHHTAYDAWV